MSQTDLTHVRVHPDGELLCFPLLVLNMSCCVRVCNLFHYSFERYRSPFMSGEGSRTVSRELWNTMLTVRITNTRRIRVPMLRGHRGGHRSEPGGASPCRTSCGGGAPRAYQQAPGGPVLLHQQLHAVHHARLTLPAEGQQLLHADRLQAEVGRQGVQLHLL